MIHVLTVIITITAAAAAAAMDGLLPVAHAGRQRWKKKKKRYLNKNQREKGARRSLSNITMIHVLTVIITITAAAAAAAMDGLLPVAHAGRQRWKKKTIVGFEYDFGSSNQPGISLFPRGYGGDWYHGQLPSTSAGAVWLTPDPLASKPIGDDSQGNIGRMVYTPPFAFLPHTSFTTSFTFKIVNNYTIAGSGMTFFLSTSDVPPPNSKAGALGLTTYQNTSDTNQTILPPPFPFFAVEFDTSRSRLYGDPGKSHVGIDINSLKSLAVADTEDIEALDLYRNHTFACWIEYEASTHFIRVWMINISDPSSIPVRRPDSPLLNATSDISKLFVNGTVFPGFTATNNYSEGHLEGVAIYAWNLSVTEPSDVPLALLVGLPSASILLIFLAIVFAFFFVRSRRRRRRELDRLIGAGTSIARLTSPGSSTVLPQRYHYRNLRKAAGGFSDKNKIGEGGYSSVYLANLPGGNVVAVKRLKDGVKKEREFVSEIEIISAARHRNLLPLVGWCYENGEALLLYRYMRNGSLDEYVHGKKKGKLKGEMKLKVVEGVAEGLDYLHRGLGRCVLHRDVKAENVLLTESYEAVLCDFGLARLITREEEVTMTAVGTPGYVAPELVYSGRGTEKADVYSFGVLAMVVACGRRPIDLTQDDEAAVRLVDWLWKLYENGGSDNLVAALDTDLPPSRHWLCVLHLAMACTQPLAESRPSMQRVVQVIQDQILLPLTLAHHRSSPSSSSSANNYPPLLPPHSPHPSSSSSGSPLSLSILYPR